jgi:NAD(P)-dependent dehydrogenase (short-subunit alcohol dehydrogenase family)
MKNYLIVGHSSGIGKAISAKIAEHHQVFGTYCNNKVESTHSNVNSNYLNVLDDTLDVSFLPDQLDGLVYCPGAINLRPFARIKEEAFLKDYKLQVTGAVKVIQACLPKLKNSDTASIVMFSTVAVQMGFNFHSLVSASKGAIEGLTKALSAELAPKIRVNCIAPSITDTPLAGSLLNTDTKKEANMERHPLKKIGAPEDIANMASFLLGDESKWVTGQVLHIDGGIGAIK